MHIAAMTSHAALTASPRLSATMANATAPRRATAIHKNFVCAVELLMILMRRPPALQATPKNKFHPRANVDQYKKCRGEKNLHGHNVGEACLAKRKFALPLAGEPRRPPSSA